MFLRVVSGYTVMNKALGPVWHPAEGAWHHPSRARGLDQEITAEFDVCGRRHRRWLFAAKGAPHSVRPAASSHTARPGSSCRRFMACENLVISQVYITVTAVGNRPQLGSSAQVTSCFRHSNVTTTRVETGGRPRVVGWGKRRANKRSTATPHAAYGLPLSTRCAPHDLRCSHTLAWLGL